MFGKLENAEDTENSHEGEAAGALGALTVAFRLLYGEDDEVGEDRQHVYDVHGVVTELPLRRTRREPHQELSREPRDACLQAHRGTDKTSLRQPPS